MVIQLLMQYNNQHATIMITKRVLLTLLVCTAIVLAGCSSTSVIRPRTSALRASKALVLGELRFELVDPVVFALDLALLPCIM